MIKNVKWYVYKRYITHNNQNIIFQARVSDGASVMIDKDDCDFTNMFEAIAYGLHSMDVIDGDKYDEWILNPKGDIPSKTIVFDRTPYENIKKYFDLENSCLEPLSSFEEFYYDRIAYLRAVASSLILDEGTDPVSERAVVNICSNINDAISHNYNNGEHLFRRENASLGYVIEASTPDNDCLKFLNKFFKELSNGIFERTNYDDDEQGKLQQFINSFWDIPKIKGLQKFSVTLGNSNQELFIPLDNLYGLRDNVYKRNIDVIGVPEQVSFRNNRFRIVTDDLCYVCRLNELDTTGETINKVNIVVTKRGKLKVNGFINSDQPKTITVKNILYIDE